MADTFTIPDGWEEVDSPAVATAVPDGWEEIDRKTALQELRRQDAAQAVSSMPAIIREPFHALAGAGANIMSTVTRPFSKDIADYFAETKQQIATRAEATRKDDWSPWASRMYGGAIESLAQAGVAAPAGPAGVIGSFALSEGNQALYEAEQAGLKGNERLKYAAVQGAIEGTIAGVFQRFAPGLEKMIPGIASGVMKSSGKQLLRATAEEIPEELLTELGHAVAEAEYGIDPNAMDADQIGKRMLDTIGQTILTMGLAHGAAKITQNRQAIEELEGIQAKGFVSAEDAAQVGIPPEESKNRASRKKAVADRIEQLQKETEQFEKGIPEDPSTSRGKGSPPQPTVEVAPPAPEEQVPAEPAGEVAPAQQSQQPVAEDVPPTAEDAPAAPPAVDEARVSELLKRRGKTGNKVAEETIRKEVAEEAEALQQYPPGTKLEIEGYPLPFDVNPDGTLVEAGSGRQMGDNAGAVLRQYKPEQITVVSKPEAAPQDGDTRTDEFGVEQVYRMVDPSEVGFTEPTGDVENHPSVAEYTRLAKEGSVPPPVDIAWNEQDGRPVTVNRRRVMAAQRAGTLVPAWVDRKADAKLFPQAPTQPLKPSEAQATPEAVPQPETPQGGAQEPEPPNKRTGLKDQPARETYDSVQKQIDDHEDRLKEQGVDIFKLYDPDDKGTEVLDSAGWKPMPLELADLYSKRNAIGADELKQNIGDLSKRLLSTGVNEPEIPAVLDFFELGNTDATGQTMAAEHTQRIATTDPGKLLPQLYMRLAKERGLDVGHIDDYGDILRDGDKQTLRDAAHAIAAVRAYFTGEPAEPTPKKTGLLNQPARETDTVSESPPEKASKPAKRVRKPKPPSEPLPEPSKKPTGRKKPKAEEQPDEFGRDVDGVLGIADSVPISGHTSEVGKSVRHFFQRFFTSRGELPQEVYDAKVRKEGRVAKEMASLRFAGEDFRRGIKTALGGKDLTQANVEQMNAVLRGEADETTVPEQVRAPLRAMRDHIDALSRMLIAEGVAQGDLVGTITENMGLYTTRSYRVFDDPQWRNKVPAAVRNRAIAAIRQSDPGKSDAEVQGMLESLLFRGAADSPVSLLKGSKLGSKDLSTFMKRKDVPEWLRDLWGEYKDAGVNYARSTFKMSHLLANQQFLNSVREAGSGKWLRTSEDGPVVNEYGDVITPIAAEGSSVMEPLNGMYTTPEIKAAFERLDSPGAVPEWLRVLMSVNYAVKYSKTVGSMMTHIRNLISNTGFAVANGHWRLDKAGKAVWGTATGMFKLPDAKFRAYYERASELGLVGEDVRAGELKDALRDASQADIDEFLYNSQARQAKKIVRAGRKGFRFINSLYQAEDGVWKLYAWENEKARYAKAHPDWSQEQVEQRAAEIVRDTYPTYSKIPEAIKGLRRFPLVGTFVSFPSEVVRTTFHTIQLGLEEMQSPETRAFGAQRLAGTVVAIGGLTVLSKAIMAMFGIGDDEDDDLRWFVPPWQENSRFIYLAKPEGAVYRFVDLGYSDPHAYLTDAAVAFMRGDDWQDGLQKALAEFLRPFASEEILAKTLMDVRSNEDQKTFNPKDEAGEQAKDIIAYFWNKALEPGTISSLRRITTAVGGTDPSLEWKTEVLAMTTGQRIEKVDVEHSLGFRVREFEKALNDIQSIARKTATSRGTATGEMVATDRARMEKLRLAEFAQMQKILGAARRLGVPEEKIRALVIGELSDDVAEQVMSGDYAPYQMTPQTVQQMLKANPEEFKERFSAWHGDKLPDSE